MTHLSVIHAHRPVEVGWWGGGLFFDEKARVEPASSPGAGLNEEKVNGGAGETLRGEERLIGFVDHLSTEEEESRGLTDADWQ